MPQGPNPTLLNAEGTSPGLHQQPAIAPSAADTRIAEEFSVTPEGLRALLRVTQAVVERTAGGVEAAIWVLRGCRGEGWMAALQRYRSLIERS